MRLVNRINMNKVSIIKALTQDTTPGNGMEAVDSDV